MRSSLAVAAGAVIGASARWWISDVLATEGFPWATLLVNLVGSAVIGACAFLLRRGTSLWYFAVTGCLGALTTMSTFATETRQLAVDGRGVTAALYVLASVGGGLLMVASVRRWAERATTEGPARR